MLLQDVLPTNERQQVVDITVPWVYTSVALLMHAPDESANINAITKPFQWPVKRKKKRNWDNLNINSTNYITDLGGTVHFYCLRYTHFESSAKISGKSNKND